MKEKTIPAHLALRLLAKHPKTTKVANLTMWALALAEVILPWLVSILQ